MGVHHSVWFYVVLRVELRALYMLGQHGIN